MNCRTAQRLISAERDGALAPADRARLDAHVSDCAACRQARDELAVAANAWQQSDARVRVPDVERAWQDIRREMRADQPDRRSARSAWWMRTLWAGVPALGAAMIALVVWSGGPARVDPDSNTASWSRFVEVDSSDTAPVVVIDDASGWVVVWTGEPDGNQS